MQIETFGQCSQEISLEDNYFTLASGMSIQSDELSSISLSNNEFSMVDNSYAIDLKGSTARGGGSPTASYSGASITVSDTHISDSYFTGNVINC